MKLSLRNLALGAALLAVGATFAQDTPISRAGKTTDRGQFAYNLNQVNVKDNEYTISFDATGDAAKAVLLLKAQGSDLSIPVELGEVKKGANTYTVDLTDYGVSKDALYTWSIELHNYTIPNDIVTAQSSVGGHRAGVVCMVDPTNEFYGYTVIGRTQNGGLDVYDQLGNKIKSAVHATNTAMGGASATTSNPMRGVQRGTTAQFACWNDTGIGVVAFDLANMDKAPYGVFEGTKNSAGLVTYGNNKVGSGTPCVAYFGEGENTILFTFDEDIFSNQLAGNPIGTSMTTNKAAVSYGFGSEMSNHNVGLVATKNGLFFSQVRGNGMEEKTPGLGYIEIKEGKGELIWKTSMEGGAFLATATGGVDINPAGDLLAVTTHAGVNVYKLSWNDRMPVLVPYKTINIKNNTTYGTVKFDAGNNLHIIGQTIGYYKVVLGQEEGIATTPALESSTIHITVPEPAPLYIAGEQMGWNVGADAVEFDYDYAKKCYVYNSFKGDDFKITTDASDWGKFDENALWPTDGTLTLEPNEVYAISKQYKQQTNLTAPEGEYTIEVSKDLSTLTIIGEEKFVKRDIYIVGDVNGWTRPGKLFEFDGTNYVCNDFTGGGFKLSIGEFEEWDDFNAHTIYPTDGTLSLEPNEAYSIKATTIAGAPNITVPEGNYSIIISKNLKTITISGEENFVAKQLYLIGDFNGWAEPGVPFTYDAEPVDGKVVYTVSVDKLSGEFLVATEGYKTKYGGATFDNAGTNYLTLGGVNNTCAALTDVTLTFTLPVDRQKKPMLTIASDNAYCQDARKPFAHSISYEWATDFWGINVTFTATGPAEDGEIVLTDPEGNQHTIPTGPVQGGVNTIQVDVKDLPVETTYSWGVSLKGNVAGNAPVKVSEVALPKAATDHAGITMIKDPESPAYGYTVIGMSGLHGYLVYDQNGTLQYGGPIHAAWQAKTFDNTDSNTMFGASYIGYAVFPNWNDVAAGYWAVNPLDPDEEPYNMLASPGAIMAVSGLWSINGTNIGGGSMSIAFANFGEETFVVNHDEDLSTSSMKNICTRRIKTGDKYITVKPEFTLNTANNGGGVAVSDKGYFVVNSRASATDKGSYAVLRYYNFKNELLFTTNDLIYLSNSCNSIACNADGSLLALTEYNASKTHIYSVEYTTPEAPQAVRAANGATRYEEASNSVPTFKELATVTTGASGSNPRPDLEFDVANNLHIADRIANKYTIYALPGESKSFTQAPTEMSFYLQTGIEDVEVGAAEETAAEYYNLQGIRVAGDALTPGIYVRRQGNTASKVLVK